MNVEEIKNKIFCGECSQIMSSFPDECIDLTITSPPYDNIRNYNGFEFDCGKIVEQLYRVTKSGGVVVWVVGDAVINQSESGTSFKQALLFKDAGFNLHDTMIYEKNGSSFPARKEGNRYSQIFEYMFVFSKGKPKTAKLICDKRNRWANWSNWAKKTNRNRDGELVEGKNIKPVPEFSPRNNIWKYNTGEGYTASDKLAKQHPALMPELLVKDHVLTWSNEGDLVLDPMSGGGTVVKIAKNLNRNYIGIDISEEYCELSRKRVELDMKNKDEYVLMENDEIINNIPDEMKEMKIVVDNKEYIYKMTNSDMEALMWTIKEFNTVTPNKLKENS